MNLELAMVETCGPEGCQVKLISNGRLVAARFSALVLNRVRILPGQMVAVDFSPAQPEIAWRWYRAQVVDVRPEGVRVQERERQLDAVRVAGLEIDLPRGAEVWVTGMNGTWEIHDQVSEGKPAHPERLQALLLPRIANLLSTAPAA